MGWDEDEWTCCCDVGCALTRSWLRAREWLCGCVNHLMVVCTGY